ncbi:hypothetical protein MASR2M48_18650 [Spirochaetota bacterium]
MLPDDAIVSWYCVIIYVENFRPLILYRAYNPKDRPIQAMSQLEPIGLTVKSEL